MEMLVGIREIGFCGGFFPSFQVRPGRGDGRNMAVRLVKHGVLI